MMGMIVYILEQLVLLFLSYQRYVVCHSHAMLNSLQSPQVNKKSL